MKNIPTKNKWKMLLIFTLGLLLLVVLINVFLINKWYHLKSDGNNTNQADEGTIEVQSELSSLGIVRMLAFNVRGNECWGKEDLIAQYLVDTKIDVFGMQENHCDTATIAQLWQNKLQAGENPKVSRVSYIDPSKYRFRVVLTRLQVADTILNPQDINDLSKALMFSDNNSLAFQNVRIKYKGVEFKVFDVHSTCDGLNNEGQQVMGASDVPYVFMGDFNCSSRTMMKQMNSWLVQNHTITCFYPTAPDSYLDDARCGGSTKGINRMATFTPPEEGRGMKENGEPEGSGPIDHHAVSKGVKNNTELRLTENFRVIREERVKFSDHWPIVADIEVFGPPIPTPTPPPTPVVIGKAVCLGFNIYDNSDDFPTIIVNSQTISPKRKLSETLTIRTAVKNPTETKSNEICWSSSGLEKAEYYQKSNWSCTTVCGNDPISGIGNGVCDDETIMKGHVTNTIQGYIEKIPEITTREKAKTNGLVFVTNIFDKTGGFCTTSPGYTETGTYFTTMTGGVDGQPLANGDVNLKCGVAADGNNCVRRVEIVEAGISEITKEDIDFSKDGKVGIDDFMKFVEYYKAGDCKVDLNKNTKCREIADFQEFIKGYKLYYIN
ncbi:endonuclease/exonuclease/phosphatase family protein [Candidatus Dojkabacteria bacterium]|nr:endonuclease/exonuclease/phosphatase family protein [Candidatus Dojkabacteria bacterium]